MGVVSIASSPHRSNRRSRVRQKVHVPAYGTFHGASANPTDGILALNEVLDIGENGVSLQCAAPLAVDQNVDLCLDLAEAREPIYTTARVVWTDASGRAGFSLPVLPAIATRQLREWLFLNMMSAADNASLSRDAERPSLPQNYSDILAAASAVQREADNLGDDLESILSLLAARSRSLLRCGGAAIALEGQDPSYLICRASSGNIAPPVGMSLETGSGFSGECVRTAKLLRCSDSETDDRVDRQTCRALGIRSMLAAPVCVYDRSIGILEVFSSRAHAFAESDAAILLRFSETIVKAINRALRASSLPSELPPQPPAPFTPSPGSVLFASLPQAKADSASASSAAEVEEQPLEDRDGNNPGGVRLHKTHLFLLMAAAATIALAVGYIFAQEKFHVRAHTPERTVLASSPVPPAPALPEATPSNLDQLRDLANHGNATAENALGLIYIAGDEKQGIGADEAQAVRWFIKAAEQGSVPAQSKLGSLYWGGRGVQKDDDRAYFWTVLARANGDETSKVLAPFISMRLTQPQRTSIEQQAEQWLQQHEAKNKSQSHCHLLHRERFFSRQARFSAAFGLP